MKMFGKFSSNNSHMGSTYVEAPGFAATKNSTSFNGFNYANLADTVFSVSVFILIALIISLLLANSLLNLLLISLIITLLVKAVPQNAKL